MLFDEPSEFFFSAGYDSPLGHLDLAMSERGLAVGCLARPLGRSAWKQSCPEPGYPMREMCAGSKSRSASAKSAASWTNILPVSAASSIWRSTCAGWNFTGDAGRHCCASPSEETRSYAQLAAAVGSPQASRAVGQANHHNPVAILVPCHRVIASDGSPGRIRRSRLAAKVFLLNLEGARVRPPLPAQGSLFGEFAAFTHSSRVARLPSPERRKAPAKMLYRRLSDDPKSRRFVPSEIRIQPAFPPMA